MRWPGFLARPLDRSTLLRTLAALAVLGTVGASAVVGLGLFNVSARGAHWPGVGWILHTTFRNSVQLRSGSVEVPDRIADILSDPDMIALGAGHYDTACRACHARPGERRSATVRSMQPVPPHISQAVLGWAPVDLHRIVFHGVKMSGMPAWPAARDDDVWPVVAFLGAVGGMDVETYDQLTRKPGGSHCAMCHGATGVPDNPYIPRLDILSRDYIEASLAAYHDARRNSGVMIEAMSQVEEDAIPDLAAAFAATRPTGTARPLDGPARIGRDLAAKGGTTDVPACRACHGPWEAPLNPAFPALAGQHEPYLHQQLLLWRDAVRGGGPAAELMHHAARDLSDDDIAALAAYYASLAPATLNDTAD